MKSPEIKDVLEVIHVAYYHFQFQNNTDPIHGTVMAFNDI